MKTIALNIIAALALGVPAFAADKDHGHEHAKKNPGPNGGRVITAVEPHLEFLVTKDRKVEITALTAKLKPGKLSGQVIGVVAGERSNPTTLKFQEKDGRLVSTNALPAGSDYPVSVSITPSAKGKAVYEKFHMDFSKCPTCKLQEYACICGHSRDE